MVVQLTVKLAGAVEGIDLSHLEEGDTINLPIHQAAVLIAEGWAVPARWAEPTRAHEPRAFSSPNPDARAVAADRESDRDDVTAQGERRRKPEHAERAKRSP